MAVSTKPVAIIKSWVRTIGQPSIATGRINAIKLLDVEFIDVSCTVLERPRILSGLLLSCTVFLISPLIPGSILESLNALLLEAFKIG